jgi:hypothetical protein
MREHLTTILLMLTGLAVVVWINLPQATSSRDALARDTCAASIRANLHNPRSVEWVSRNDWQASAMPDGSMIVTATYRAANAFGATVLSTVQCELVSDGSRFALQGLRQ